MVDLLLGTLIFPPHDSLNCFQNSKITS